ncbi:MAG TPA: AraC family transcriptional regulator [Bacillota bacterium]|nr:AraC family transcriptional regulator [Bacillota bacterium]HPT87197.1 AraC family transcriptional regulator [Bacillota bacterium]
MELPNVNYSNPTNSFSFYHDTRTGHYNMRGCHFHSRYEIYYLVSGERFYFIHDRTYLIQKGDLVLISPYVIHKTMDTGKPHHERYLIEFDQRFVSNSIHENLQSIEVLFKNRHVIRLSPKDRHIFERIFETMLDEVQNQRLDYEIQLQSLLQQLLIYAARNLDLASNGHQYISQTHAKVSEIVKFINTHYAEDLTLVSVAEQFEISHFYLSRLFKAVTGFAFIEYLNSIRIKEAQRLLRETNDKVQAIANAVGFVNQSHFGRIFKEITGTSPLQYRKELQRKKD